MPSRRSRVKMDPLVKAVRARESKRMAKVERTEGIRRASTRRRVAKQKNPEECEKLGEKKLFEHVGPCGIVLRPRRGKTVPQTEHTNSYNHSPRTPPQKLTGVDRKTSLKKKKREKKGIIPREMDNPTPPKKVKVRSRTSSMVKSEGENGRKTPRKKRKTSGKRISRKSSSNFDPQVFISKTATLPKKAAKIAEILKELYPDPPIPLNHWNTFTLLVAVMLSAQTTDGKVNDVTMKLFKICPTPATLAAIAYDSLLAIVRSVGLAPTKSKNLINMAKMLISDFDGNVPSTMENLVKLPGVGRKTASVVLSQAFNLNTFPVDTHIHRLAVRWGLAPEGADVLKVEHCLRALYPAPEWRNLHLQMIYFGREWCQAKKHEAKACPVCCWAAGAVNRANTARLSRGQVAAMKSPKKASKNIILCSEARIMADKFKKAFGLQLAE
ncbi:hypothetical protein AAMO2058_000425000 [Amorphochlora amoebiformis]|mmetsp:Transcript_25682/g.40598  ORF Transcript_25682/g.40598 Transcript_25682/m.40598 type:complete len:440 (-) Transcript_25682:120-1439(-)